MTLARQAFKLKVYISGRGPWRIRCKNCDMEERGGGKETETPHAHDWVVALVDAGWGVRRHNQGPLCPDCYAVDMETDEETDPRKVEG